METPAQRCARLVAAFEELVADEAAALREGDFAAANTIADRAEPIVGWLSANARVIAGSLRARIDAIATQRTANADFLEQAIARTRDELQGVTASRRRVAQIAPVYGRGIATQPTRLSAVG